MTIASQTNRVSYAGNGSTTAFAFSHPYRDQTDFLVYLRDDTTLVDTLQTLNTHYTISGVANAGTGGFDSMTLTMVAAPATGKTLVIVRRVPPTTALDANNGASLTAPNLEGAIDRAMLAMQGLQEQLNRALLVPEGSALTGLRLPEPRAAYANYLLGFNSAGTALEAKTATSLSLTAVSAFMGSLLDDADASTARQTLALKETFVIAVSDETTSITTGTAKVTFRMPYAFTLSEIPRASLTTVSSSGLPAVDINKNGASIFSTTLTIDANEKTSKTAATAAVLSGGSTSFADDDEVTIDIDTAGTGAKGLKVYFIGYRTGA